MINIKVIKEVKEGLRKPVKQIPSKYFYDEKGSLLFDKITELDEYYLTCTEMKIMDYNIDEICSELGENILLLEFGSGSSLKTRLLLQRLKNIAGYIPVDISKEHLENSARQLRDEFPGIDIYPLAADYTHDFKLPKINKQYSRIAAYYPGSTIGNFTPGEAKDFLERTAGICGSNGVLLIGVDLKKDIEVIEKAYNDRKGVTADFNLNILENVNNITGSNFKTENFIHCAFYNKDEGRIEMHLISKFPQNVTIDGEEIKIKEGENILTEYSYKYSQEDLKERAKDSFIVEKVWMDEKKYFSVQLLRVI